MSVAHKMFSKSKEFESVQLKLKWELSLDLPCRGIVRQG